MNSETSPLGVCQRRSVHVNSVSRISPGNTGKRLWFIGDPYTVKQQNPSHKIRG